MRNLNTFYSILKNFRTIILTLLCSVSLSLASSDGESGCDTPNVKRISLTINHIGELPEAFQLAMAEQDSGQTFAYIDGDETLYTTKRVLLPLDDDGKAVVIRQFLGPDMSRTYLDMMQAVANRLHREFSDSDKVFTPAEIAFLSCELYKRSARSQERAESLYRDEQYCGTPETLLELLSDLSVHYIYSNHPIEYVSTEGSGFTDTFNKMKIPPQNFRICSGMPFTPNKTPPITQCLGDDFRIRSEGVKPTYLHARGIPKQASVMCDLIQCLKADPHDTVTVVLIDNAPSVCSKFAKSSVWKTLPEGYSMLNVVTVQYDFVRRHFSTEELYREFYEIITFQWSDSEYDRLNPILSADEAAAGWGSGTSSSHASSSGSDNEPSWSSSGEPSSSSESSEEGDGDDGEESSSSEST